LLYNAQQTQPVTMDKTLLCKYTDCIYSRK